VDLPIPHHAEPEQPFSGGFHRVETTQAIRNVRSKSGVETQIGGVAMKKGIFFGAIGAIVMYLFDPEKGPARRAKLQDQFASVREGKVKSA
jgi:hypothetical protein